MRVINREACLFLVSGIDSTDFHKEKKETTGIICAMMSEVTSFDLSAGIGLRAFDAFFKAKK